MDAATLRALNERLVVTTVTAFGTSGPRRHWRGSDLIGWATSGSTIGFGDADRPPIAPGGGLGHAASALNAAVGTLLALRAERRSGRGQAVDISLQEAVLSVGMEAGPLMTLEGRTQQRTGRLRMGAHGLFRVQDGSVEVVAVLPTQWDAMAQWLHEELGIEEATFEVFRGQAMARVASNELIETWVLELMSRYTKQAFFEEAQRRGIPCGPVNSAADLLDDPHLEAIGAWVDVEHPEVGTMRSPRGPVRFDGVPTPVGSVPAPGQHNDEILGKELGLKADRLAELRAQGVV
jgi:formyl-CoA transferase